MEEKKVTKKETVKPIVVKDKKTTTKNSSSKKKAIKEKEVKGEKNVTIINEYDRSKQLLPRLAAYALDMLIVAMLVSLISGIRFLNPDYDKFTEASTKYSNLYQNYLNNNISVTDFTKNSETVTYDLYKYGTSNYVIALIIVVGYFGVFQYYNKGQTIGKRLLKIRVVLTNGKNIDIKNSLVRVLPLFIITYGGIFSILSCIFLPHLIGSNNLGIWITAITITNCVLGLVDAEFAIARKDKRALHDLLCNTKLIDTEKMES